MTPADLASHRVQLPPSTLTQPHLILQRLSLGVQPPRPLSPSQTRLSYPSLWEEKGMEAQVGRGFRGWRGLS
jgi:hypothetical protein